MTFSSLQLLEMELTCEKEYVPCFLYVNEKELKTTFINNVLYIYCYWPMEKHKSL
jgi:hypothetical protein